MMMNHSKLLSVLMPLAALTACGGADEAGSNVALRDMEVIDGTANDAMVDLDNAPSDIAPMANSVAPASNSSAPASPAASNESSADEATPKDE